MKKPNWPILLASFIVSRRNTPFVWGTHDCSLFIADAVKVITDRDIAAAFRGRYSTAKGAQRALKRYGKGTLTATMDALLPPIYAADIGRGDVAQVQTVVEGGNTEAALAICTGRVLWLAGPNGLTRLPRSAAECGWRVA